MKHKFRFIKKINNQDKLYQMNQANQRVNNFNNKTDIICRLHIIIKANSLR